MIKHERKNIEKVIRLSVAFISTLHLSMSTALCGHFELDSIDKETHKIRYNSLPAVEESDALLKGSSQFNSFLNEAEEIVTRYELEPAVGLRLIHRHFTLDEGQLMAEEYDSIDNVPSLVTYAHKFEEAEAKGAIPASWMFSGSSQDEILLFEASNDPAVKTGSLKLQNSPEFFDEMGKILTENNLHHLLSVALLKRDSLVAEESHIYMEVNSRHEQKSVVQIWDGTSDSSNTISTSWAFKGPRQQKCWPIMKCIWVPDYPKGAHRYLLVDHTWKQYK
ncbi:MAG: hypothetical protein H0X26_09510 [Alphaproteobacteria bacterium]|nr:hypothetical protein [Alphaproteobacteria bacterium]